MLPLPHTRCPWGSAVVPLPLDWVPLRVSASLTPTEVCGHQKFKAPSGCPRRPTDKHILGVRPTPHPAPEIRGPRDWAPGEGTQALLWKQMASSQSPRPFPDTEGEKGAQGPPPGEQPHRTINLLLSGRARGLQNVDSSPVSWLCSRPFYGAEAESQQRRVT